MKLALRVLELMPFPWRFSRASLEARQDFLARLEGSSIPRAGDLLLFLKVLTGLGYGNHPRVRGAVGYEMRCEVPHGDLPADGQGPSLGDLSAPKGGEECDIAIVGSGAGGAVTAAILAEAGLEVVVLEAGRHMDRRNYPDEPLAALTALYRDGGLTIAEGRPAIPTPVGRAVGGTTVINSGTCFRAPEQVLANWRTECGIEWAGDLDGEYEAAEEMLRVRPVDPERMGRNGQLLREGAEALGVRHEPLHRNAGRCFQCRDSCPSGCRLDASGHAPSPTCPARWRPGPESEPRWRLEGSSSSRVGPAASIAWCNERLVKPFAVRARRGVVLAGGAFGTPELLLRSGFRSPSGSSAATFASIPPAGSGLGLLRRCGGGTA